MCTEASNVLTLIDGDKSELLPATKRVERDLRRRLARGEWSPGALLPSRRELARQYAVNLTTVQRAVARLAADGEVRSAPRRGAFVADRPAAQSALVSGMVGIVGRDWFSSPTREIGPDDSGLATNFELTRALEKELSRFGVRTQFVNLYGPRGTDEPIDGALKRFARAELSALAFLQVERGQCWPALEACGLEQCPAVFVGYRQVRPGSSCIYFDDGDAGLHAGAHLIEQGCRDLLFFSPLAHHWARARMDGVRAAVDSAGLPTESFSAYFVDGGEPASGCPQSDLGYVHARKRLAHSRRPTGVVAANDQLAYGYIRAAAEIDLLAGRDYAIIGFDDETDSRRLGLTTFQPPLAAMGREAANLLRRLIAGEAEDQSICLQSHLVLRSSSRIARASR